MDKNSNPLSTGEVCEHLSNLSRRRQVFRSLTMLQLRALVTDAQRILDERHKEIEKSEQEEKNKEEAIRQALESLKKDGILPKEIKPYLTRKKPSIGVKRKYLINGEVITYSGVGRMPAKLKNLEILVGRDALQKYELSAPDDND